MNGKAVSGHVQGSQAAGEKLRQVRSPTILAQSFEYRDPLCGLTRARANRPTESASGAQVSALDSALAYTRRGWSVVPVPFQSKNPGFKHWQQLRLSTGDLSGRFNGKPQNIGVLLGEPSNWLIDIDLDHPRAVELVAEYLPPTPAIFGRKSKPRSHWIYRVTAPVATKKHNSKSSGMIVELRSTGMQTVFPPSMHESGELIEWNDPSSEPAEVDPEHLLECVKRLAEAVKVELGERAAKPSKKQKQRSHEQKKETPELSADDKATRCMSAMMRMQVVDKNDGSSRLYACACRVVEHDLDDQTGLSVIAKYSRERPFSRSWTDDEILQRFHDAEKNTTRGRALQVDAEGHIPLGERDAETGRIVLSPRRTLPTADAYVREFHAHPNGRTVHNYSGLLFQWAGNCYREVEDEAVRKRLQKWLHEAVRYGFDKETKELVLCPFDSNPTTVNASLSTIRSFTYLPVTTTSPSWLTEEGERPLPVEILPCRTKLLHLPTNKYLPATPTFFTTSALEFDPDPKAPEPKKWFEFLHQLFDGDCQSHDLLHEWFGYCLTGDTSLQKMMLIVGPRRSGKGTIARVLEHLIGLLNVCGPTTSSLAGPFGLQPLICKTLATVSDARFHGDNIATVVERLLCISGEDLLTIDRKHLPSVTMKLPTRFMFLSNEFPRLSDASGALAGRFMILRLTKSFYGKEDPTLTKCLLEELPGILNWAIEGWHRLHNRGHFVMPTSVEDAVREIEDLSSPVSAFVRERCVVGAGHRVDTADLYEGWRQWCGGEGRQSISSKQIFGRDLAAAIPGVSRRRGTDQVPFYEGIGLREVGHA